MVLICILARTGLLKAFTAATRRGCCSWICDHAGELVTQHSSEERYVHGRSLEDALASCLEWLMAKGTPGDWGLGTGTRRVLIWTCAESLVAPDLSGSDPLPRLAAKSLF